jgi:small GTP-binding protein
MNPLLSDRARQLLEENRDLLRRLLDLLRATDAPDDTVAQLEDAIGHLDELFLVVVVGEFNAGKSTLLNALFGETVMEEGPIPTTAKITLLRHGDEPITQQRSDYLTERRLPIDLLRHLTLVDTPGTNSIVQEHQRITENFIPRSDLVLFVTSFDRPLTESERQFLSYIRDDWGRRLVVVINKADLAESEKDLAQVVNYVESNCKELLDVEATVLPVSARLAARAKSGETGPDSELWTRSQFEPLENLFTETLTGPEQVAVKLTAPLDTADRLLGRLNDRLKKRGEVLEEDEKTLDLLQSHLDHAEAELEEAREPHLDEVEDVFADVRRRGTQFLSDTIRVRRLALLRDRDRFRRQFEAEVVQETTRQIENVVTRAVDGLLSRTMKLQQTLFETFAKRIRETRSERQLAADRGFAYDRAEIFDAIMDEAEQTIRSNDLKREVDRIVENVYSDANLVVGAGVGAAAAGGLGVVLLIASALDAVGGFGLATGAAAAVYGATVLPRQRRKAIDEFEERIDELQERIQAALRTRLDREIEDALGRVWETVEPFSDFVESERETLTSAETRREELREDVAALRKEVRAAVGRPEL